MNEKAKWSDWLTYVVAFIVIIASVYTALIAMDAYTPEAFSLLSAFLLAGIFEKFRWLKVAWDKLTSDTKRLVMWAYLAVLVFGAFGLSCANVIPAFECTWPNGVIQAAMTFLLAAGVNQGTHRLAQKNE